MGLPVLSSYVSSKNLRKAALVTYPISGNLSRGEMPPCCVSANSSSCLCSLLNELLLQIGERAAAGRLVWAAHHNSYSTLH